MFWLLAAALMFFAWLGWQLFRPTPPIRIAPETTRITAPLLPDGRPNYSKHLLAKRREGVTPENNAAVVMWRVYGLSRQDFGDITADDWQVLDRELSLGPPPAADQLLTSMYSSENRQALIEWLNQNAPDWQRTPIQDPAMLAELKMTQQDLDADSILDQAMSAPWKRSDLPPLADWVNRNRVALDALVAASKLPHFYSPSPSLLRDENAPLVEAWTSIEITRARDIARVLKLRAMFHIGSGRLAEAWQDLLAIHRWARLVGQGAFVVDQLVAIAIDGIALAGDVALLGSEGISPDFARQVQRDLFQLGALSDIAKCIDEGERIYFLDSIVNYRRKGLGAFYAENFRYSLETGRVEMSARRISFMNLISADWNHGLVAANSVSDQMVTALKIANYPDRNRALEKLAQEIYGRPTTPKNIWAWFDGALNPRKRNEMLKSAILAAQSPNIYSFATVEDRANASIELTQIAAALAVYRAEHGQYPDRLEQLVPEIISELPVDLYHAKPFIYRREADGYLLYSTGPNGADDGGSNELRRILQGRELPEHDEAIAEELGLKIPTSADDLSIRIPASPFQLPTSPAPAP